MTSPNNLKNVIIVCGPTATGKSDLAVKIALYLKEKKNISAEIISTDSRQVYTDLDIGTGKITRVEMQGVPHHMLDVTSPLTTYGVFAFAKDAMAIMDDIHARGNTVILCGGTGQYIDALVTGHSGAPVPPNQQLRSELEQKTIGEVEDRLYAITLKHGCDISHVDLKNKRRMIRAIEIIEDLGYIPKTEAVKKYNTTWIGLDCDSEKLRGRIQKRLDTRIDEGMVEESINLLEQGKLTHDQMFKLGLEYRYISLYLQKTLSDIEWREQLFFAIWHYAKRQRTWFKRNPDIVWFDALAVKNNPEKVFKLF